MTSHSRASPSLTHDFLLEIGCEELPADYLPAALDWTYPQGIGLSSAASLVFAERKIVWKELKSFGTARRLVLKVSGMESQVREELEGPPVSVAFDSEGKPTEAARSFAARQGVALSQLKRKATPRGERLVVWRVTPVTEILKSAIPQIIQKVTLPKTMRWDESGIRFARAIRWLLALYGSAKIPFVWGSVQSGQETWSLRRADSKPVRVKSAAAYFDTIRRLRIQLEDGQALGSHPENGVKAIPFKRRKRQSLLQRLEALARRLGGRLSDPTNQESEWLLDEVSFLAEEPIVAIGSYQREYLDLPPEVLTTAMAKHLKLLSIYTRDGKKLLPKFLAVLEGKPTQGSLVMKNITRILEARFTDAGFFYREDTKSPLESKVPGLEKLVFHEKLGSVGQRIPRLARLMEAIASQRKGQEEIKRLTPRLAELCKADLVTQMVREFPSLQGVMGGHYAKESGEPRELVAAISEIYQPRAADDPLPSSCLGAIGGLADRIDTLIGFFGVGLKPTGSADPFSLRRQATGLVRILTHPTISFVGLSIDRLIDEGIQSWGPRLSRDPELLKRELRAFLRERFEWLALTRHPIDRELVAAVLAAGEDDLADAWARLMVLWELWQPRQREAKLLKAAKVAERTGRMVKSAKANGLGRVNPEAFKEASEKRLWEVWNRVAPQVREQIQRREYAQAVTTYGSLYLEVHQFFEKVFVMDENPDIRKNRLALINEIYGLLSERFADLSKLPL